MKDFEELIKTYGHDEIGRLDITQMESKLKNCVQRLHDGPNGEGTLMWVVQRTQQEHIHTDTQGSSVLVLCEVLIEAVKLLDERGVQVRATEAELDSLMQRLDKLGLTEVVSRDDIGDEFMGMRESVDTGSY